MKLERLNLDNLDRHIQSSFDAIALLYQFKYFDQAKYCSFILIDQLAWLVSGSEKRVNIYFKSWLNKYFTKHYPEISADELWASRNGLLHNSSSISRDTVSGKASRQLYFVDNLNTLNELSTYCDGDEIYCLVNTGKFMQVALFKAVEEFRKDLMDFNIQDQEDVKEKLGKLLQPLYLNR
ncbi:hypothetical protein HXZ60_02180 [Acinetobacter towneri]|uniref:hypothetical protein n=1 Tax=Acinetobacter towneri TaxID=202956 RepID=UPI002578172E|nr:hypothetical protein [Acinetobacter towneri]MDM1282407.1 hypothetical protein [Acinetobacter towneri]